MSYEFLNSPKDLWTDAEFKLLVKTFLQLSVENKALKEKVDAAGAAQPESAWSALQTIIDYPITSPENMDAANMKLIAVNAMCSPSDQPAQPVVPVRAGWNGVICGGDSGRNSVEINLDDWPKTSAVRIGDRVIINAAPIPAQTEGKS